MKQLDYKSTERFCYFSYITQAIVVTVGSLFFSIFQDFYGIEYGKLSLIVFVLFMIQLVIDALSVKLADKIGIRNCGITAHLASVVGLVLLSVLPVVLPMRYKFAGIMFAVCLYSVGGGIIEVITNPILESLPQNVPLSLLHGFYSWGQVGVVLGTTALLAIFGKEKWYIIPIVWAIIPVINLVRCIRMPMPVIVSQTDKGMPIRELMKKRLFICGLLLLICAAASEQIMAQWASLFVEKSLGINKELGDILGLSLFALFMGIGRTIIGIFNSKIRLSHFMIAASGITFASYLIVRISDSSILSLCSCCICGLGVSILWPGTLSLVSSKYENGGTPMFSMLSLAGDTGCSLGPTLAGLIAASESGTAVLKNGISIGMAFSLGAILLSVCFIGVKQKGYEGKNGK